jgi:16S rRNA processing protein RimM
MSRDVLLGVVIGARGLSGALRVKCFAQDAQALAAYGPLHAKDGRAFVVERAEPVRPGEAVIVLKGVVDREGAEALKGLELYVARDALPAAEGSEYYHADLIGLRALDEADRFLGLVSAIHNFGAGDVIEIAREEGGHLLLPFAKNFVPVVDVKAGFVVVANPEDRSAQDKRYVE